MAIYTEGGIGRKQCTCGAFISAVYKACPVCNIVFQKKVKEIAPKIEQVDSKPPEVIPQMVSTNKVLAPAGPPPHPLIPRSDDIIEWANKTKKEYEEKGDMLSNQALRYLIQKFYNFKSPGYNYACECLDI